MFITNEKSAKRSDRAGGTQQRGDPQHQAHVPRLGLILVMDIVMGESPVANMGPGDER